MDQREFGGRRLTVNDAKPPERRASSRARVLVRAAIRAGIALGIVEIELECSCPEHPVQSRVPHQGFAGGIHG